ncbi:MAG TPA: O-antigen ligase family protein [Gaiellaceae bacterium]|nr:O-antigen ligase family protein [Gaiellaceae bacterium]
MFRRPLLLERAIRVAIPVTIVLVALGSNWSPSVRSLAQPLWRVSLVVLCGLAVAWAYVHAGPRLLAERLRAPAYAATAAFAALAAASTLWSVDPRLTLERTFSFVLVLATGAALALGSGRDPGTIERLAGSVLAGAVAVGLAGLAVLVVVPHDALQTATATIPTRYRGIGQNPNTDAMLFAAALPLATWVVVAHRGRLRTAGSLALLLLAGPIVASGSRGALITGALGTLALLVAIARGTRTRLLVAVGVAAAAAAAIGLAEIPQPNPKATGASPTACRTCRLNPYDADRWIRLEDDLDRPASAGGSGQRRTFLATTGRGQAWEGTFDQAEARPVAGYGFGTEDHVFVDRYYSFFGGSPENSYIGMFLQLGIAGIVLLIGLAATLLATTLAALRRIGERERRIAAACAAALVTGLGLAVVQSSLYAVGNTATLAIWTCGFLGLALASRPASGP